MRPAYFLFALPALASALDIRLITFNIRYDNKDIGFSSGEAYWLTINCSAESPCRMLGVVSTLYNADAEANSAGSATIIGLQEVLDNQLSDLLKYLPGGTWAHVGVARDDGKTGGEYAPILYRTDVWNLIEGKTRWLSETPDVPGSISWGSGSKRIVTAAVLEHKATGRRVLHANTHLDNVSAEARQKGVGVVLDTIKALQNTYGGALPISLTGDFNSNENDGAYKTLATDNYLKEIYGMTPLSQRSGEYTTYTGFLNEVQSRMDFIWLGSSAANMPYVANKYATLDNRVNGTLISDHRPVVGDVTLK